MSNFETRLVPLVKNLRSQRVNLPDYLSQLEAHFAAQEPQIQAFLPEAGRFERLRNEASELAQRYPHPTVRPPLYGVPVGIKDIFHVDGFPTQAGSRLPAAVLAGAQAASVTRLKQAGTLLLGKTVTTEFAYFAPGPTHNPHNLAHTPGGSSSGSAAGVAAGLCPLALGTQTIGSIIRPAAFCGVVGFKPSFGRVSTRGVIPLAPSLDHVGFFTQDVAGAALAASILIENWRGKRLPSRQPVLGVPIGPYLHQAGTEGLAHFENVQEKLTQAGFELRRVAAMPDFDQIAARLKALMAAEAAQVHQAWFQQYGELYRPPTIELITRGQKVSSAEIEAGRAGQLQLRQGLTALMAEYGVDLWLAPAAVGPAPLTLDSTGDPIMNLPWTYAGLPVITLPAGLASNGLPLGLQIIAGWQEDEILLAWAGQIATGLAASLV